jgi:5-methyltetrahydropteroyltriglutamate--homocysteine methyltransferase
MRNSRDKILTTHVGALPGPAEAWTGAASEPALRAAVDDVVRTQRDLGIDIVNEGELTKGGNGVTFINARLTGFEPAPQTGASAALLMSSADWQDFDDCRQAAVGVSNPPYILALPGEDMSGL